jgi:hypothetical protein
VLRRDTRASDLAVIMASRYHWVTGGASGASFVTGIISPSPITVPAGGRMVRYWVNPLASNQVGPIIDPQKVGARYWFQEVKINSTQYPNRVIFSANYGVNHVFFPSVAPLLYGANNYIGYETAGLNNKCSYGGPGKGAITFQVNCMMGRIDSLNSGGTVPYQISFGVLYYL